MINGNENKSMLAKIQVKKYLSCRSHYALINRARGPYEEIFVLTFKAYGPNAVRLMRLECQNKYFPYGPKSRLIRGIIRWRSISMRAGPAFLQFDWSKASLSMDVPVFVYSHTKAASDFFQDRENIGKLFMWLQIFYFKQRRWNLTGLLFCPDLVCQGLLITKSVICIRYLIVSSPHAVRRTTFVFCMSHECKHVCF